MIVGAPDCGYPAAPMKWAAAPLLSLLLVGCPRNPTPEQSQDSAAPVASQTTPIRSGSATDAPPGPPMMIDFTRDFCLPCQVMAPDLAALRREQVGRIDVVEVNIDREGNERFAVFFVVESVPSQVFVDGSGTIAARHSGIATKHEMLGTLKSLRWIP